MFTVVIPLYNKAASVRRTIESVMAQAAEWELLVVDNNSTDGGFELVKQHFHDPRIRLLTAEKQGVSHARNAGIREAKYTYVCFLDADDTWQPNHLQELSVLIEKYPKAGLFANSYEIVEANGILRSRNLLPESLKGCQYLKSNFLNDHNQADPPFNINCIAIRKDLLNQVGGFNPALKYGEDIFMVVQLISKTDFIVGHQITSRYYRNAENRSDKPEFLTTELLLVEALTSWYKQEGHAYISADSFNAFIARQLFLSGMANLHLGRNSAARGFFNDPRMDALHSQLRRNVARSLSYLPVQLSRQLIKLMIQFHLIN